MVKKHKSSFIPVIAIACLLLALFMLALTPFGKKTVSILNGILFDREINLRTTEERSVNVLLLGIGGGAHDGPNLTDTIIFINLNPEKNIVNLVSIPRDLWVPDLQAKINTAYAFGKTRDDKGILLAENVVEKVVGQQIDYTIVVDFAGFIKLVDLLGGIEVAVERAFDDNYYPIPGKEADPCGMKEEEIPDLVATASSEFDLFPCRYQTIHFDQGLQTMDGEKALLYVRSRHATGVEGSDFSRSKRQNQVIKAVRDKALSVGTVLNPVKVLGIYNVLKDNLSTSIDTEEFDDFIKLGQKMEKGDIRHHVIDVGDIQAGRFGLIKNPTITNEYRGQWVLAPRVGNGNFSEIHKYVECIVKANPGAECVISRSNVQEVIENKNASTKQ
jgi:polyisoprenyl-teichoic acid--peptidoglycan teichoic acid transferase